MYRSLLLFVAREDAITDAAIANFILVTILIFWILLLVIPVV